MVFTITDSVGNKISAPRGTLLIDALLNAGLMKHDFPCGKKGVCRKCQVRIKSNGQWNDVLACQTAIESNIEIDLFKGGQKGIVCLQEGCGKKAELSPAVRKVYFPPSFDSVMLTWEDLCLRSGIHVGRGIIAEIDILLSLSLMVHEKIPFTAVIQNNEIVAIERGDTRPNLYGMAFDIGTTTIAGYLFNLVNGRLCAAVSSLNPQVEYGSDVISRITYATEVPSGLERLQSSIVDCINGLIDKANDQANISREDIYDLVFVGNPCMEHLFLGVQPVSIGRYPYTPIIRNAVSYRSYKTGILVNNVANIFWLPGVSGFVGADTLGMLLAHPLWEEKDIVLAIDIGTNGEIVLAANGKIWACSTAAGSAFEGYSISCGMRAQAGAIDSVQINNKEVSFHVIGDVRPQGICGSGLVDAVAGLLQNKNIDFSGRLVSSDASELQQKRIIEQEGSLAFLLVPEEQTADRRSIYITQQDIRKLQLAKSAISTGIRILLRKAGVQTADVTKVILAGAFGMYLKFESLKSIKLLPDDLCEKIVPVGNAAGVGAQNALLSVKERKIAQEVAENIQYIELAGDKSFEDLFLKELSF